MTGSRMCFVANLTVRTHGCTHEGYWLTPTLLRGILLCYAVLSFMDNLVAQFVLRSCCSTNKSKIGSRIFVLLQCGANSSWNYKH